MTARGEEYAVARSGRRSVRARVGRERRVLRIALLISAALHVVAIAFVGGWLDDAPSPRPPAATPLVLEPPPGMRAINLVPVPAGSAPADVSEPREPEAERPIALAPADLAEQPPAAAADDRSAADRLAPRLIDPRLWKPIVLIPREPTFADVEARVGAALELLSDSALADAERRARATDWTVADASGGRWGITPGWLHLGKVKLPLPIAFVEGYDPERGEWYDLEAQVNRAEFLESFEERVKKIRERRDRERRERREREGAPVAGGSGG